MLVSLLVGFGVGMMLLNPIQFKHNFMPMQERAVDMAAALQNPVGAFPRNAPLSFRGFSNQQWQPQATFRPHGLYDISSSKAIDSTVPRVGRPGSLSVSAHLKYAWALAEESSVLTALQSALKVAEDCVGECAVEWDDVEELSAAAADEKPPAKAAKLTREDVKTINAYKEELKAARVKIEQDEKVKTGDEKATEKVLAEIASAASGMQEVVKKVATEKSKKLEDALASAIEAAKACTGAECAVAWDTVEELSAAMSKEKAR